MTDHTDCIFCGIVRGTIPAVRVCEDERTVAFMDLYPAGPGHTLVIPKLHAANLFEIAPADLTAVALTTQRVAQAVLRALAPDGIRIMQTNGAAAGQTVAAADLRVISGDLAALPTGIITDPQAAIGKTLRNSLGTGQPLRSDQLLAPLVIRQGQSVRVVSRGSSFAVTAEGRALNNAAEGQLAQVRMASGQTVSGIARADGSVEISF